MGYRLVFWKQPPGNHQDPHAVYAELMEGATVAGLEALSGDRFVAKIAEAFSKGWKRLDEHSWEGDGTFQIEIGPQHFLVTAYGLRDHALNRLIDIGRGFGCKLYDPQTKWRFEG